MNNKYKIVDITEEGRGVAKKDKKVFFIKNAYLEDEVSIKNIESKKRYFLAEKDETLVESKFKIKSKCKYFGICENCIFQNLMHERELEFKKNKVINNLRKIAKLNIDEEEEKNIKIFSGKDHGYRNKLVLKIEEGYIGYFKRKKNNLVKIDKCIIAKELINKFLKEITEKEVFKKILKSFKEIIIKTSNNTLQISFMLNEKNKEKEMKEIKANLLKEIEKLDTYKNISEIYIEDKENKKEFKILEKEDFTMSFLKYNFKSLPKSFFQVNTKIAEKIYIDIIKYSNKIKKDEKNKVERNKEKRNKQALLDLYSGVGVSTILLADSFEKVISVELSNEAVKSQKENIKKYNKKNVEVIEGKVEEVLEKRDIPKNAFVFVDPPRAGLKKNVIEKIINAGIENIMYMSCSSDTFSRDLKEFLDNGYVLKEFNIYDMFPRTHHVETLAVICKK